MDRSESTAELICENDFKRLNKAQVKTIIRNWMVHESSCMQEGSLLIHRIVNLFLFLSIFLYTALIEHIAFTIKNRRERLRSHPANHLYHITLVVS